MRYAQWMVAVAVASLACGGATGPGGRVSGGGQAGRVLVGNNFFQSDHNGSQNPAVDTIAAGSSITWAWAAAGSHSIQSTGVAPAIFRNSTVMSSSSSTYTVTFQNPGTYPYQCGVHGALMPGRIVVQ